MNSGAASVMVLWRSGGLRAVVPPEIDARPPRVPTQMVPSRACSKATM